jgi:alpha-L-rhamnosidase
MKGMQTSSRVTLSELPPFPAPKDSFFGGQWPAHWIALPGCDEPSFVGAYRLKFEVSSPACIRIHVSADQRYELFLDGDPIGLGPERGDAFHWHFESYDLNLAAGEHLLVARVWTLANRIAPAAQISLQHGFLLAAEAPWTEVLSTGLAAWEVKKLEGYTFADLNMYAGGSMALDGRLFPWHFESDAEGKWTEVVKTKGARSRFHSYGEVLGNPFLRPARLPAMIQAPVVTGNVRQVDGVAAALTTSTPMRRESHRLDEASGWQKLIDGEGKVVVPAQTRRRVIIDLNDYYCGYASFTVSGGGNARVRLHWAESAYEDDSRPDQKGNRDELEGKLFRGRGPSFTIEGSDSRKYRGLSWEAGRYLELQVETDGEPLTFHALGVTETRYPLEMVGSVELGNANFQKLAPIFWRTLQMCAHETYMDCPYYEQLMYTGDTRLQVLITLLLSGDERLPRKAIEFFGASLISNGLTQSRYPSDNLQFSLFWIAMLHDFALWRGDQGFIRAQMPVARTILETFISSVRADGLLAIPNGWDWVDWVEEWPNGAPPKGKDGISAINHWQFIMVLTLAAELEDWLDEPLLATRLRDLQEKLAAKAQHSFWNEEKGLFADTTEHHSFSEHVQCYAILSRRLEPDQLARLKETLAVESGLTKATYYFQHYLFEAWRELHAGDRILSRVDSWISMADNGAKTAFEKPDPTRSDCHAWSAHPLFHAAASIIGIRPGKFGFKDVVIQPQMGTLEHAATEIMHPGGGRISAVIERKGAHFTGKITLPDMVAGRLRGGSRTIPLHAGEQTVEWTEQG